MGSEKIGRDQQFPKIFDTRSQFCRRQFSMDLGVGGGWNGSGTNVSNGELQ